MKKAEILRRIDHTELRPNATVDDYLRLAEEAERYEVAAVCVPPNRVRLMRKLLEDRMKICTVVGFPCGYNTVETKVNEAINAIGLGVDEIDMVINIGDVVYAGDLELDLDTVSMEIALVRQVCADATLKVIIETCYLSEFQKINLCRIVTKEGADYIKTSTDMEFINKNRDTKEGADYIKTSTGFGPGGASLEDIKLLRTYLGPKVKIKAAGGISTPVVAKDFLLAGCDRIGSSGLVRALAAIEGEEV